MSKKLIVLSIVAGLCITCIAFLSGCDKDAANANLNQGSDLANAEVIKGCPFKIKAEADAKELAKKSCPMKNKAGDCPPGCCADKQKAGICPKTNAETNPVRSCSK